MANKAKWMVVILVMIAFLSSCQTNEVINVNTFTQDYTVYEKDWKVGTDDASGNYLYYEFQEPNLTHDIYDNGSMQAFLFTNGDNVSPLPFDDFRIVEDSISIYRWTEQVTCEFRPGYVAFILKYNDHLTDNSPLYANYKFRVRFLW